MKNLLYRIIINDVMPDSLGVFSGLLEKEFGYTLARVDEFVTSLPRILYKGEGGKKFETVMKVLRSANVDLSVHKLVKVEGSPVYIDRHMYRLILKVLNMALRAGTDVAMIYLAVGDEDAFFPGRSFIGSQDEISRSFRRSDFVLILDERTLLFLGFATHSDGLRVLEPKLKKAVQGIVGSDVEITFGEAAFPKHGYALSDIIRHIQKNFGKNRKDAAALNISDKGTVQEDTPAGEDSMRRAGKVPFERGVIERRRNRARMIAMLNQVEPLPVIAETAVQVYQLASDPNADIEDVEKAIATDPGLALNILKLANTSFYGMSRQIDAIRAGILHLGMREIAQQAFGLGLARPFSEVDIHGLIDPVSFQQHAVGVGAIGRFLCETSGKDAFKGVFTACLLHDIGKLFLIRNCPGLYTQVMRRHRVMQIPLYAAEEELFGLNHGVVGGMIAKKWNLPDALVQAISFHHHPPNAPDYKALAAIVAFSDALHHMHTADPGNTPETGASTVESMAENLMERMDKGLVDLLSATLGDVSKEMIVDRKNQVSQFLRQGETGIGSRADA